MTENDASSAWLWEPVRVAYKGAVAELRSVAQRGKNEAAIVLDAVTSRRLDFQSGDQYSVGYAPQKSLGCKAVIALHTHVDESPPGSDDWDVFLLNPEIRCVVAVTPTQIYILEKPDGWNPQNYKLPTSSEDAHPTITPFALFVAYAKTLRRRYGIADTVDWENITEETRNAIFAETNELLRRRFDVIARLMELP